MKTFIPKFLRRDVTTEKQNERSTEISFHANQETAFSRRCNYTVFDDVTKLPIFEMWSRISIYYIYILSIHWNVITHIYILYLYTIYILSIYYLYTIYILYLYTRSSPSVRPSVWEVKRVSWVFLFHLSAISFPAWLNEQIRPGPVRGHWIPAGTFPLPRLGFVCFLHERNEHETD